MAADVVCAKQRRNQAEQLLRRLAPLGLAGEDEVGACLESSADRRQFSGGELMKDQVATDDIIGAEAGKCTEVGAVPACVGGPEFGRRTGIEPVDVPAPAA